MKRYISILLVLFCLSGLLTGCVHGDVGVQFNKDGTGSITTMVGVEENTYYQLLGMGGDVFDGKSTSTYKYDGKTYIAYTEFTEYNSFEEIEKALLDMTYASDEFSEINIMDNESNISEPDKKTSGQHIFKSVDVNKGQGLLYTTYSFNAQVNTQYMDSDDEITENSDVPKEDVFHMTLTVEMPADISHANGGTIEDNIVVFNLNDLENTTELSVISEEINVGTIIIFIVLLLVILILFFAFIKRKNNDK